MRYELSTRIVTSKDRAAVGQALKAQFTNISRDVRVDGEILVAKGIQNTFGSINRTTEAKVTLRPADGGYLAVAQVTYKPSGMFWVFILIGLFFAIFWILPVIFYLTQKGSVRIAVGQVLERVKNEFDGVAVSAGNAGAVAGLGVAAEIEALEKLRKSGVLTDEEFSAKKQQLLKL